MNGKKIVGWLVRGGIAAVGCSSMGAGSIGGKNYCGNLLWQSSVTLLPLGEPYAGKLHVRFDEGAGVPDNKGRPALLYTLLSFF